MGHRTRRSSLVAVAVAALAFVAMPAAGGVAKPKPKPKPKPNLVVKDLVIESTPAQSTSARFPSVVLDSDRSGRFGVAFTITNTGKGKAPKGQAEIFISGKKFDTLPVGPIPAGKAETVRTRYNNQRFKGPGNYDAHVCVDGKDCSKHVPFSVVPRRWNVDKFSTGPNSLVGGAPFFTARSEEMTFDYYGAIKEDGEIDFVWLATGTVTEDVSGDDGTCSYSGHGAVAHSPWDVIPPDVGYLVITPQLDGYFAEIKDDNHGFLSTQTCPGIGYTNDEEQGIIALETIGLDGRVDRDMQSTAKTLAGSYNIPTGFGSGVTVGEWSFKADLP